MTDLPLNRQRIIKFNVEIHVPIHPMSVQCQCFDKRRGVFYWKKSAFFENKGAFWPEISAALGVFSNFDNERMHPKVQYQYQSAPRGV